VSKAADRSSRMRTEDLEAALASLRASITESRAVTVSNFETRLIVFQEIVLCKKGRDLIENSSFKCFCHTWKKGYRSVIFQMCWIWRGVF